MDRIEKHALHLITTGQVSPNLVEDLGNFDPGSHTSEKAFELLSYNFVRHRIEFDVARDVSWRLKDLDKRVLVMVLAFLLLMHSDPSETAVKYLERRSKLYLTGFSTEAIILCGAVLEAAVATSIPDSILKASGMAPNYRRTGVYSLGQRMQHE